MIVYKPRDVLLVKFFFSEESGFKKRPVLVISKYSYNRARNEIIVSAITSNIQRKLTGDYEIKDWEKSNLLYPSLVTGIIRTIKREMIEKKIGELSERDFRNYQENLRNILALSQ